MEATNKKFDFKQFMVDYALIVVVLIMIIFTGMTRDNFISLTNFSNLMASVSIRFIIALGCAGCLIIRGTDLSAGRIVGLSALITGTLVQKPDYASKFFENVPDMPIFVPLLIVLVVCALFGLINGLIIAYLHVPPFLATLGTQIMIYGINMLYSQNKPIGNFKDSFIRLGQGKLPVPGLNWIPYLGIIAAVVGILIWILFTKTRYGKYMYAIGGNEAAAEVSGVNVEKSKVKIFALAGFLYGLAGYLLTARTGSVGPGAGQGYELEAIASATIGGVSTAGGQGTVPGILLGVFVFELLKNSLSFLGVSPDMTNVIQGIVIVIAVALDVRRTLVKK